MTVQTVDLVTQTKLALRRLAKSVVVVTCRYQGKRYAMAATAVDALSMEPPSMLACVNRSASLYEPLAAGADFCINILRREHEAISKLCGGQVKGEERVALGSWEDCALEIPVLSDAQASLICANEQSFSYGTHGIFVGRVIEVRHHGEVDPLIYVDGRYTAVAA